MTALGETQGSVDLGRLEEITNGDREFAIDLVDTFLDQAGELTERIGRAAAEGDTESLRIDAHTLRGSSSNFDAGRLQAAAKRLEQEASNGSTEALGDLARAVDREFGAVRKALEDWRAAPGSRSAR